MRVQVHGYTHSSAGSEPLEALWIRSIWGTVEHFDKDLIDFIYLEKKLFFSFLFSC